MARDQDLMLGVEDLDREHRLQIAVVDDIRTAVDTRDWKAAAGHLDRLSDATGLHFAGEEILMRERAYPGYQAHRREHDDLMDRMTELRAALGETASGAATAASDAIREWLSRHIDEMDRSLGRFLGDASAHPHT